MNEKIQKWRNSRWHRKCAFCSYLHHEIVKANGTMDFYVCIAKNKNIRDCLPDMTRAPRPFCSLFELNVNKAWRETTE